MQLKDLVEFSKCFGNESRIKIMKLLAVKELCVCELESITGQTQPSISQHLRILYSAGLVEKRRDGQWIYYSLNREVCNTMVQELASLFTAPLEMLDDFQDELSRFQHLEEDEQVRKCKGHC